MENGLRLNNSNFGCFLSGKLSFQYTWSAFIFRRSSWNVFTWPAQSWTVQCYPPHVCTWSSKRVSISFLLMAYLCKQTFTPCYLIRIVVRGLPSIKTKWLGHWQLWSAFYRPERLVCIFLFSAAILTLSRTVLSLSFLVSFELTFAIKHFFPLCGFTFLYF